MNPNGLYLGKPGSGKSFAIKRGITNTFFVTNDDVIVCDPEGEYYKLAAALKGQVIKLSPTSEHHINPLDIAFDGVHDEELFAMKAHFVLSLCELILANKDGLEPEERTIIDSAVLKVYAAKKADPANTPMPILEDLWNAINSDPHPKAQRIATALQIYVTGSLKIFNNRTNIDINNRFVCFDVRELSVQLRTIGMLIVQDCVWTKVSANRDKTKSTHFYIDEFHLFLKDSQTAQYAIEFWKRFRKWGGIPTGITQNVTDLLHAKDIETIFENSDFVILLDQAQGDREILAKKLGLSQQQKRYITGAAAGEGLICYGGVIIPFIDRFPKDTQLYRIMTTKLEETSDVREKRQFATAS